jgi:periplasmic protein CpxP/Spy
MRPSHRSKDKCQAQSIQSSTADPSFLYLVMAATCLRRRGPLSSQCERASGLMAAWGEVMEGKAAVNLARHATFAAMIATIWAVCATASPIATIEGTFLRTTIGTDSETLTLIPGGASVEVGDCGNGLCLVVWIGHHGYASGLAQGQIAGLPAGGQAPPAPPQMGTSGSPDTPPLFDPAARIKYLHDRLRITPEQGPLWDTVARTIRDNARDIVPLLRERFRATTSGSALDVLHSYEALGEAQLDSLEKFIAAFGALCANLSEGQKKIADAILREDPLSTMVSGVPDIPAPLRPRQSVLPGPVGIRGVSSAHSRRVFSEDQAASEQR